MKRPLTHTMTALGLSVLMILLLLPGCRPQSGNEETTRGIGIYPGDPAEYSGPELVPGGETYRNLALRRIARHSSSYDYNLTAQLATDGIPARQAPTWLELQANGIPVTRQDREKLFDSNTWTTLSLPGGGQTEILLLLHGGSVTADRLSLSGTARGVAGPASLTVEISPDGERWTEAGVLAERDFPGGNLPRRYHGDRSRNFYWMVDLPAEPFAAVRLTLAAPGVGQWELQQWDFSRAGEPVDILPSARFCSAWMAAGTEDEWLSVDLGAAARFDKLVLSWVERPEGGVVETSADGVRWMQIAELPQVGPLIEEIPVHGRGRYVRLAGLETSPGSRIVLGEMEVWGRGGVVPQPREIPGPAGDDQCLAGDAGVDGLTGGPGRLDLRGGAWRLQRASEVSEPGTALSVPGYPADGWLPATVPGTVLTSYFNAGAVPDQRYDDDQLQISESFFLEDFWYRDEFDLPAGWDSGELMLHFDGINWKAEVFVNGTRAGQIDGAFTRAAFDVGGLIHSGRNALAVKVLKNAHPGIVKEQDRRSADLNGGVLGADNPTMHATIGWDWIPTVRGRNIGIWNDVWLSAHRAAVTIDDVFVDTDLPLPSVDYAMLKPVVTLTNHGAQPCEAGISLRFGDLLISGEAALAAGETRDVPLPETRLERPQLWWPAGYGEPHLYAVQAGVSVSGMLSDTCRQFSGVREMSYREDGGVLDFYVNGRRLIGNGGNWGYPEVNLNYRAREYDIAVAYHADMHFTMIRNWVGMTGDDEFWEACDRHGVMVWQDFWLANPADGPEPADEAMFLANAEDFLRKIRHHPCLALYCGRNEGNPPASLDAGLAELVSRLHPGLHYIPHSADGPVSGGGPYRALPPAEYFALERGADRFHSERGMPNVPTVESLERMLSPAHRWPQDAVWGMHDYCLESAQSAATFNAMVAKAFGEPASLEQFAAWAQWIDYEGYRAIFESRSAQRKGIQLWMSHSCWPSMVWQTYDYYFAPTAAYFGAKKGSAPVRIQWNPVREQVEVVNNNAGDLRGLTAQVVVATPDGAVLSGQTVALDAPEDTTTPVPVEIPGQAGDDGGIIPDLTGDDGGVIPDLTGDDGGVIPDAIGNLLLLRLRLIQDNRELADNFYVLNPADPGNLQALRDMPSARVELRYDFRLEAGQWRTVAILENRSSVPALMLRLNLVGARDGEQILPVFYEDNWISLLPGERREIAVRCADADTRGGRPALRLSGFNLR